MLPDGSCCPIFVTSAADGWRNVVHTPDNWCAKATGGSATLIFVDFRIAVEPQQGATFADQLAAARVTESAGYSAFFRTDHYLAILGDGLPGPTDTWITLAGIARETSRVRLGTMVTSATFRFPGPLAVAVAQVDEMSGGRVEFGLGAGWYEAEHLAYGIPYPPQGERFDRLTEQLHIVTGLWKTPLGETFDYVGDHYTLVNSPALPKPVQHPGPPIIIGGWGQRRTPALAAEFASEYNIPNASPDATRAAYQRVANALKLANRSADSLTYSASFSLCVGRDEAEVTQRAVAMGRDVEEFRSNSPLVGTPNEIVDRLGAYIDVGVQRVYAQLLDMSDLDHIEFFAERVVSQLH